MNSARRNLIRNEQRMNGAGTKIAKGAAEKVNFLSGDKRTQTEAALVALSLPNT